MLNASPPLFLVTSFKCWQLFVFFFIQIWGTFIMQKTYKGFDYLAALLVTLGCSIFILFPVKFWSLSTMIIVFIIFLVVIYALNAMMILNMCSFPCTWFTLVYIRAWLVDGRGYFRIYLNLWGIEPRYYK